LERRRNKSCISDNPSDLIKLKGWEIKLRGGKQEFNGKDVKLRKDNLLGGIDRTGGIGSISRGGKKKKKHINKRAEGGHKGCGLKIPRLGVGGRGEHVKSR